jgi:hypothetical protein
MRNARGGGSPPPVKVDGRMTGGGNFLCTDADGNTVKTTHGFELHCDIADVPNNLEVNWDTGNNFHLDTLTMATCFDNPLIDQSPPNAPLDTLVLTGTGTFNNAPATVSATLVDAGEPGTSDTISITIVSGGITVLSCTDSVLDGGNHQAHNDNK